MKKRLTPLILTLALCLGLAVPAFAADEPHIIWLPDSLSISGPMSEKPTFSDGRVLVQTGDWELDNVKYGYVDRTGQVVIPVEYDTAATRFSEGLAVVGKSVGKDEYGYDILKYGYIDTDGKVVVPLEYDLARDFSGGVALVCRDSEDDTRSYGLVDKTGNLILPLEYESIEEFSDGLARVSKKDENGEIKYGFVDSTGKVVIPPQYDRAEDFSDGLAAVAQPAGTDEWGSTVYQWGFIDKTNKMVIPAQYDSAGSFYDGYAAVAQYEGGAWQWGFIDQDGKLVVPYEYSAAYQPEEGGLAVVGQGNYPDTKYGIVDMTGKLVLPCEYDNIYAFTDGLALVENRVEQEDGGWVAIGGFVDKTGKMIISPQYNSPTSFFDGMAIVYQPSGEKNEYGFDLYNVGAIDTTGKLVIPFEYDEIREFHDGLALAAKGDPYEGAHWGMIDKTGKVILPFQYDYPGDNGTIVSEGLAVVSQNNRSGIVDLSATTAMPTNDKLTVDGQAADPTVYKIGDSNYFKIRDVAALLNGTGKQFSVDYDNALRSVTATTGQGYDKLDTDLTGAPSGGDQTAVLSNDTIYVNGEKIDAQVYKIDGGNYFKLRDLGKALDFSVDWTEEEGMIIDTSKPYSE